MRALNGHLEVIKCGSRCDPGTQNPFQQKPRFRNRGNTKSSGERLELGEWGGAGFTDCCSLVMGCQEDGREAEEGSQAGGISAAAFAIPVKDVDLGWLKVEAGIDLNHRAGPAGGGREVGGGQGARLPCWDLGEGGEPDGMGSLKPPLEGEEVVGPAERGSGVTGLGKNVHK